MPTVTAVRVATDFSGMDMPIYALRKLKIRHVHVFASDSSRSCRRLKHLVNIFFVKQHSKQASKSKQAGKQASRQAGKQASANLAARTSRRAGRQAGQEASKQVGNQIEKPTRQTSR